MKKIIALILVFTACVSLFACTQPDKEDGTQNGTPDSGTQYEVITNTMLKYCCSEGSNYNINSPEPSSEWRSRHDNFEIGEIMLYGCAKVDGGYRIVNPSEFGIKYKVLQDLGDLKDPNGGKNGATSLWINSDTETAVLGTNIDSEVGVGAYYIKIKYADGKDFSINKTNMFMGATQGSVIDMLKAEDIDMNATIVAVEVTVVYEMYSAGPGILGIWWTEHPNWRCEFSYNFGEAK